MNNYHWTSQGRLHYLQMTSQSTKIKADARHVRESEATQSKHSRNKQLMVLGRVLSTNLPVLSSNLPVPSVLRLLSSSALPLLPNETT